MGVLGLEDCGERTGVSQWIVLDCHDRLVGQKKRILEKANGHLCSGRRPAAGSACGVWVGQSSLFC